MYSCTDTTIILSKKGKRLNPITTCTKHGWDKEDCTCDVLRVYIPQHNMTHTKHRGTCLYLVGDIWTTQTLCTTFPVAKDRMYIHVADLGRICLYYTMSEHSHKSSTECKTLGVSQNTIKSYTYQLLFARAYSFVCACVGI